MYCRVYLRQKFYNLNCILMNDMYICQNVNTNVSYIIVVFCLNNNNNNNNNSPTHIQWKTIKNKQ